MTIPIRKRIKIRSLFSGIGRKFMLYFIFFSILPIVLLSYLGYRISEDIFLKQNIRYLKLENELILARLNDLLSSAKFELAETNPAPPPFYRKLQKRFTETGSSRCPEAKTVSSCLEQKIRSSTLFTALAIIDTAGNVHCPTDSVLFRLPGYFFRQISRYHQFAVFDTLRSDNAAPVIIAALPVESNFRENVGYVAGAINTEKIREILAPAPSSEIATRSFILNRNSEVLFSSTHRESAAGDLVGKKIRKTEKPGFYQEETGEPVLRMFQEQPVHHWSVVSEIGYSTAMAPIIWLRNRAVIGVGALMPLLFLLALYVSRRLSVPLRQLVYSAQDIGHGLLDTPIRIQSRDEIGMLARELDEMRRKLSYYYENLENKVEKRTEELKKAQYQIMHQEKMASLGLMAAGIAHEIGNPITAISSLTQVLERRLKNDENIKYLTTIMKNIDRVAKIVRELVDFSRPSNYESGIVNINEIARSAIGIVKYDKRSRDINFHLELDHTIPTTLLVADQILQVFINILFNAVDAMEGYGNDLYLRTYQKNNHIYVEIEDSGSGIPQNDINKIFEPFYTTKEIGKGTGLGLSVSYGIVKNFKGDISVKSERNRGSVFTIKIPVQTEREAG
ncbi:MAG TPA: HAMP domain-containing protein [Caldithrix sp.]|nr:HAMP domain-containing protein [Caldithrix sp.]